MKRKFIQTLFLSAILIFSAIVSLSIAQSPAPNIAKIDPRLLKILTDDNARAAIIIDMKTHAENPVFPRSMSVTERRLSLKNSLQSIAETSQVGVRSLLAQAENEARAGDIRPLWIINAVAARADRETVLTLAQRDDIAQIRLDEIISLPPATITEVSRADTDAPTWGIAKINADTVWQSLGIDGTGIVVANIDTGVDFLHPDLKTNYRGYGGKNLPPNHTGNFFDATGDGALYPVDNNGHGTHTMGTIAGQNGIGVAPGARWIAVRAFNSAGQAQESWLHAAFEWLIAPNGDPALAPDIVSNSWSNSDGASTVFEADIQNLLTAGIIPVFAAGNSGSAAGSVGSPGSLDIALAVGATDSDDFIAYFSGRGASPWGSIKPDVSAPGVDILSAFPGGAYAHYNGTSMATPHVAGTLALLKQAQPTLTFTHARQILIESAIPLGNPIPNNDYGWGRIDALYATELALNAGEVTGIISNAATAESIPYATLDFVPRHSGITATAATDNAGVYRRGLVSGNYDITAAAFGFSAQTQSGTTIITGTVITRNFALSPLPTGQISGQITDGTRTLSATITVEDTPVKTVTDTSGNYQLNLPAGNYTLTVRAWGYKITRAATVPVSVGQNTVRNFSLSPTPTILLVDSGAWYNAGQISYYQNALTGLDYLFHTHAIRDLSTDVPISDTLRAYDVVIWSAPNDSPGFIGGDTAISDYLDTGGNLLLSGQDVAYFDGGGSAFFYAPYLRDYLKTDFLQDNAETDSVLPVAGDIFDGLSLTISGGEGANNQTAPDVIQLMDKDSGRQVLAYPDGRNAGQVVGHCLPYRALVLPFGIEGISQNSTRAELLNRTLDWFQSPRASLNIEAKPITDTRIGNFGESVTHTVRLFNTGESGSPESFSLSVDTSNWAVSFPYTTVVLSPCQTLWLTFSVNIPTNVDWDSRDIITLTAQSESSPTLTLKITRTTKSPAPILLVDDERWYNYEDNFTQALDTNHFKYDIWSVQGDSPMGTPPLSVLNRYPQIIWFTGYDWFSPLTPDEENTLQQYLDTGGRLAFSSQEYLYVLPNHEPSDFARDYFGVDSHSEALTSTMASGVAGNPIGDGLDSYPFTFPEGYQNWTDSLTPTAHADTAFISDTGFANALTNFGTATQTWHTAFFAFGPELLADNAQSAVMNHTVGWLSWLGASTLTADKTDALAGDAITYTAILRNDGSAPIETSFTATFTYPLTLETGFATGGAIENNGQVLWQGTIIPQQPVTLTYRARVSDSVPYGTLSRQHSQIGLPNQHITFDKSASVGVNTANLQQSTLTPNITRTQIGDIITYTLNLQNNGFASAPMVTITGEIPLHLQLLTLNGTSGTGILPPTTQIEWDTPVTQNNSVLLTFSTQVISIPFPFTFPLTLNADDGFRADYQWTAEVWVRPKQIYMPLIFK